jgi:hypothetical protein
MAEVQANLHISHSAHQAFSHLVKYKILFIGRRKQSEQAGNSWQSGE